LSETKIRHLTMPVWGQQRKGKKTEPSLCYKLCFPFLFAGIGYLRDTKAFSSLFNCIYLNSARVRVTTSSRYLTLTARSPAEQVTLFLCSPAPLSHP
uniref:Uncharacterized protein n=1 Tax=Otus sunia TaxID=257818 RepID=A0A8C8BCY7_9STRI